MEIIPGVHSIAVGKGRFMGLFPPQAYLVMGQEAVLIDAGEEEDTYVEGILELLKKVAAPPLRYIWLTHSHPDHAGGVSKLCQATGARAQVHRLTAADLPAEKTLEEGYRLELGGLTLQAIHTPGHTMSSMCFLLREERLLFSGDNVLGMGTAVIRPQEGDMAQYIASLEKLLTYDIALICPGHGPVIRAPQSKLRELIQHRRERELQVMASLSSKGAGVEELLQEIYPELDSRLRDMARDQILAHLAKLEREGKARQQEERYFIKEPEKCL